MKISEVHAKLDRRCVIAIRQPQYERKNDEFGDGNQGIQ